MKKPSVTIHISGILILILLITCNCKKVYYDYSNLWLNQYYVGNLSSNETMYLQFQRADSLINGTYFIYNNGAITTQYDFWGKPQKNDMTSLHFQSDAGVRKTKGFLHISGDTIIYNFGKRKSNSGTYTLIREKPQISSRIRPRYTQIAFPKTRKQTITYGNAKGYYTSKPVKSVSRDQYVSIILDVGKQLAVNFLMKDLPLELDLYQPIGDTISQRPLLVMIHGGAFIIGDKDSETMVEIAEFYAQRGFVVASINYRLGYMFVPGGYVYLERCMYRAIQDARASIRYLVHYARNYRIATDYIFIGGNSAGGFIAMKTAFMEEYETYPSAKGNSLFFRDDLGCLDCSGNNFRENFSIRGVINMWGALTDTSFINSRENIPTLHFHGDIDKVVPPNHDYPFANVGAEFSSFFSRKTFGSVSIHQHQQQLGHHSQLVIFPNACHDPQVNSNGDLNDNMKSILAHMGDFLNDILKGDSSVLLGKNSYSANDRVSLFEVRGKGHLKANWSVEGGKLIQTTKQGTRAQIVWFSNEPVHRVTCTVSNENGWVDTLTRDVYLRIADN
jgi:acetyl esterase/lipase